MYRTAIMLFPGAEELDFVGPLEVLSCMERIHPDNAGVDVIAKSTESIRCANGLRVVPNTTFDSGDAYDILVIPGGEGRRKAMHDREVLDYISSQVEHLEYLCSVCTGSFIVAEAGLLAGLRATTHHTMLKEFADSYPDVEVMEERVVKNHGRPNIWIAAGVTSGIDLSLEIMGELFGDEGRKLAEEWIEYPIPL